MPIRSASRNSRTWSSLPFSKYRFDGKPNGAVTDGGHPRFGLAGGLEVFDALNQRSQERFGLQQRQHPAHTGVHAIAETEAAPVVSSHVEAVRRIPAARVAVGGGEHQTAALARRNDEAINRNILHGDASGHAGGRVPAQAFLERGL